jgi:hypothetical protein
MMLARSFLWVLRRLGLVFAVTVLAGCSSFNRGLDQDTSRESMVCKDGIKYLPFTNGRDQAYTSEGRPETCPRDL